jgi:hypothetical protein
MSYLLIRYLGQHASISCTFMRHESCCSSPSTKNLARPQSHLDSSVTSNFVLRVYLVMRDLRCDLLCNIQRSGRNGWPVPKKRFRILPFPHSHQILGKGFCVAQASLLRRIACLGSKFRFQKLPDESLLYVEFSLTEYQRRSPSSYLPPKPQVCGWAKEFTRDQTQILDLKFGWRTPYR